MAQVKLIEAEPLKTFNPVTIQITFETQEELNAMRNVCANYGSAYKAAKESKDFIGNSRIDDFWKVSGEIYQLLNPLAK